MDEAKKLSPEGQVRSEDEKPRVIYRVEMCLAWAVFLAAVALLILTGSSNSVVPLIVGGVWAAMIRLKFKKLGNGESVQEPVKRMIIFLLITAFSQLTAPFYVSTAGAWRYPIVKEYVKFYNTTDIPDWLPDRIPGGAKDYDISYLPSVMQGNGHFSVRFTCDEAELDKLESMGREMARYILPLTDYIEGGDSIYVGGYATSPAYEITGDDEMIRGQLSDVRYDRDFWQGYEDETMMYVVYSSLNTHKAHSEVIIVNRESGMVQLFAD